MAVTPAFTLFLLVATLFFITNTTSTAVNSTKTSTNTTSTTAINSTKATNSTIPATNTTPNSTKPITATVISRKPTTSATVISRKPTTSATVNPTKPTTTITYNSITPQEVENLLETLRYRGYSLFSNAISTSDVQLQLLSPNATSSPSFTIFAPKDHFLYTLDMATDADAYVAALKCHVIPSRQLTIRQLSILRTPYLDTLLPHYSVLVGKSKTNEFRVTVDGVRISDPDLYVRSGFAVHGLDGILLTGFNMYEDTTGTMDREFFSPGDAAAAAATPRKARAPSLAAARVGGFSRAVRKRRKLQYRRVWRKDDI